MVAARVNLVTHQAGVEMASRTGVSPVEPVSPLTVSRTGVSPVETVSPVESVSPVETLLAAVRSLGFSATVLQAGEEPGMSLFDREAREAAGWRRRFLVGLIFLMPILWLEYLAAWADLPRLACLFALVTPLEFYVGWPYLAGAWRGLRRASATMDTLIALGTGAAYLAGAWELVHVVRIFGSGPLDPAPMGDAAMGGMYFADAAMILTFISLGKFLETKARGRASQAIRRLMDLSPPEATVLRDGQPQRIAAGAVPAGETIVIRPGEKVPLDGKIVAGSSSVDQSWLTGESIPVDKQPGDEVFAGTLNLQGSLTAEVLRPAARSAWPR